MKILLEPVLEKPTECRRGKNAFHRFRALRAFTLVEVMIAVAIFFMAMFAILALVTQTIKAARSLTITGPTAGMVAAFEVWNTNILQEGVSSGDFEDIAPSLYRDYDWTTDVQEYLTNGMFQVHIEVFHKGKLDSTLDILAYKPDSPSGLTTQSKFR